MQIKITLHCPDCQGTEIKKNGRKSYGKQNYFCKACGRQFIGDHALQYRGCHSSLIRKVLLMPVRGIGIRDIVEIENISIRKVLSILVNFRHSIRPDGHIMTAWKQMNFGLMRGKKAIRYGSFMHTIETPVKPCRLYGENGT